MAAAGKRQLSLRPSALDRRYSAISCRLFVVTQSHFVSRLAPFRVSPKLGSLRSPYLRKWPGDSAVRTAQLGWPEKRKLRLGKFQARLKVGDRRSAILDGNRSDCHNHRLAAPNGLTSIFTNVTVARLPMVERSLTNVINRFPNSSGTSHSRTTDARLLQISAEGDQTLL